MLRHGGLHGRIGPCFSFRRTSARIAHNEPNSPSGSDGRPSGPETWTSEGSVVAAESRTIARDDNKVPLAHVDSQGKFEHPGSKTNFFTTGTNPEFISRLGTIPTYRVLSTDGKVLDTNLTVPWSEETAVRIYQCMIVLNLLDGILYTAQRQGRISFYMTAYGEEAACVASAAALDFGDQIFAQYRESGALVWRGYSLDDFMNQCFGTADDVATKGRQMPVHYGSRQHNFVTISSPLATQIPQAAGAAYALKREGKKNVVICYFGEGAASEGDFHAGLNFSATLSCPVIWFCRNNGFAISTATLEQYKGDGIASRAVGYGIDCIRVDGNDAMAVYQVVQEARRRSLEKNQPVLIEAMTYRVGHHSTSDDSSAYRAKKDVEDWKRLDNPMTRMRKYLETAGLWTEEKEDAFRREEKAKILAAFAAAEKRKRPSVQSMFDDVYQDLPNNLQEQRRELNRLLKEYPDYYDLSSHDKPV